MLDIMRVACTECPEKTFHVHTRDVTTQQSMDLFSCGDTLLASTSPEVPVVSAKIVFANPVKPTSKVLDTVILNSNPIDNNLIDNNLGTLGVRMMCLPQLSVVTQNGTMSPKNKHGNQVT
jgi:hypothetical protein